MKKIYIAGPITGNANYREDFKAAERILSNKYITVNPVKIIDEFARFMNKPIDDIPYNLILKIVLQKLMECDAIYLLKGWEFSRGAIPEHAVAVALRLEVLYQ